MNRSYQQAKDLITRCFNFELLISVIKYILILSQFLLTTPYFGHLIFASKFFRCVSTVRALMLFLREFQVSAMGIFILS
jgi:hypothetical protein